MDEIKEDKCPYAKKVTEIADVHFDCRDCPALECPFPKIKEEFERSENDT